MRMLLATLLSLLVGTAAGQEGKEKEVITCNTARYTRCFAEHVSGLYPSKCEQAGFTGDAMCACQAQWGVCAVRYGCSDACETTMTALGCGVEWCKAPKVTKPFRYTTVYRFTKKITRSQLYALVRGTLSTAINPKWISISTPVDTSVQTPSPTVPSDLTRKQIDSRCSDLDYASDCEAPETFGFCRWTGTACGMSDKKLPSEVPVPPSSNTDVRTAICDAAGQINQCSLYTSTYCAEQGGRCVPDPNKSPVRADAICNSLPQQTLCTASVYNDFCTWSGGSCRAKGGSNPGPGPSPGGSTDVRTSICDAAGQINQCSLYTSTYCAEQGGRCVPDPNKSPVRADAICNSLPQQTLCTTSVYNDFCTWSGGSCRAKSNSHGAAVLAGGPWEAEVSVEVKAGDSAAYMSEPMRAALPSQLDNAVTASSFKDFGATVEQSTVSEKANEGTAGGGGSDGMSTGAIVGIVFGCLVGIALVGVVGFMVVKRKNTANMNSPPPKASANDYQDMQTI